MATLTSAAPSHPTPPPTKESCEEPERENTDYDAQKKNFLLTIQVFGFIVKHRSIII